VARTVLKCLISGAALASTIPAVLFAWIAWGEWRCGLMGLQFLVGVVIAAFGLSLCMVAWPRQSLGSQRFDRKLLLLPWLIVAATALFVFVIAPPCPFLSR
jgi:hypothetical protein